MKNLIIASTSTVHGSTFLEYLLDELTRLFKETENIVFVPYARPGGISYNNYTEKVKFTFKKIEKSVKGIHEFTDPVAAIKKSKGIFIGGGNTFVLLNELYKNNLIHPLKEAILSGTPYLGTSAGSNICGLSINTTNDMPIVYPRSFNSLGILPFNINPHYLDSNPANEHMGETRETRIQECHIFNTQPIVGLREGSFLRLFANDIILKGPHSARIFQRGKPPYEIEPNKSLSYLY